MAFTTFSSWGSVLVQGTLGGAAIASLGMGAYATTVANKNDARITDIGTDLKRVGDKHVLNHINHISTPKPLEVLTVTNKNRDITIYGVVFVQCRGFIATDETTIDDMVEMKLDGGTITLSAITETTPLTIPMGTSIEFRSKREGNPFLLFNLYTTDNPTDWVNNNVNLSLTYAERAHTCEGPADELIHALTLEDYRYASSSFSVLLNSLHLMATGHTAANGLGI
jgi:hypothetical protein